MSEQHGAQVQGDGAEDVAAAADIADAGQQRFQRGALLAQRLLARRQAEHQGAGQPIEQGGRRVHPQAAEGKQETAEGRGGDGRGLHRRGRGGYRRGEQRRRHQAGQQRLGRRHLEGAGTAEEEGEDEDQLAGHFATAAAQHQGQGDQCLARLAQGGHLAPVVAVGDMPGVQHEQHSREELHQAHQAQVEHVAGQLVHMPADGHGEHLEAAGGADPRQPEGDERTLMAQEQLAVDGHGEVFRWLTKRSPA
jgi:hypothetical protein